MGNSFNRWSITNDSVRFGEDSAETRPDATWRRISSGRVVYRRAYRHNWD